MRTYCTAKCDPGQSPTITGMVEGGSPFPGSSLAMPSPGARGWPSSPSKQGPSPASHHLATSPGHPALHSPQTHKDGEHTKVSGRVCTVSLVEGLVEILPFTLTAGCVGMILKDVELH